MMKKQLFAVLLLAFLAFCKSEQSAVTGKASSGLSRATLRMNLTPSLSNGQVMIAKDEGEFEREGIDAEFVTLDPNSANLAIASGDLDVFFAPMRSGIFNLIARGASIRIVADKAHSGPGDCSPSAFTAPPSAADRIAKSGSIRGEKLAVVRGNVIEYLADRLLEHHQLTPADVELVEIPMGEYLAVSQREISAVRFVMEPILSNHVSRGDVRIVAGIEEIAPGTQLSCVVFGKRLLQNPELGRRFMRAYLRAVRRYNEGKTDRNVAIISRYTKLPPDIIRRACWEQVRDDGRIDARAVTPFLQWALRKKYLDREIPTAAWWDPSFVDASESLRP